MPKSSSEAYLHILADRSFLRLWALPNTYFAPNKELTDLIVPFGDDIIIISDKACEFDFKKPLEISWPRWYRKTIQDSVRQLKTAMQRLKRAPENVFSDAHAKLPIPIPIASSGTKRFHLVGIARPHVDPLIVPPQWQELHYQPLTADKPFHVGKIEVGDQHVHIFDGPTIDLLLDELDTAPDFIAYLTARENGMDDAADYSFAERDLLGAALIGWEHSPTRLPTLPPLKTVVEGLWDSYSSSPTAHYRREADRKSYIIDDYIAHVHEEFVAGRMLNSSPSFAEHEYAMRLLAAESRFARRVVAHELYDILYEPDQSTFWATTVPSPSMPTLRYVWLIYPLRPEAISEQEFDHFMIYHLQQHVLVAQALFPETIVLGIALPNRSAEDTATFTVLHDGSSWTEYDRAEALKIQEQGVFSKLEPHDRFHIP